MPPSHTPQAYMQFVVVIAVLVCGTVTAVQRIITSDAYVAILGAALGYAGAQQTRRRSEDTNGGGSTGP